MSLLMENGPYFGYYFGENRYAFKSVGESTEIEVGSLLTDEKISASLAASTWTKLPIPSSCKWSEKRSVYWLLQEGYVPVLKGNTVKFYPTRTQEQDSISTTSSFSEVRSSTQSSSSSSSQASSSQPVTPPVAAPVDGFLKSYKRQVYDYIDKAIDHYRSQISMVDSDLSRGIICPITLELMRDPVVDEHEHSFEKCAIEEWKKKNDTCPVNQSPFTKDLHPNESLKGAVEKIWGRSPIPLLPSMLGQPFTQNDLVVGPLLAAARQLSIKNDPHNAIQMMTAAFSHTGKSEDYELLPEQYIALKETQKGILAILYLGKRKIAEGKQQEAIHWFEKALKQDPDNEFLRAAYAASRLGTKEAADDFRALAQSQPKENFWAQKKALHYWESALMSNPKCGDLYDEVIPLTSQMAKLHLCLKGVLELYQEDPERTAVLYQKAVALDSSNPLPHLARLSRLEETNPHRFEVLSQLPPHRQIYFLQLSLSKAFAEVAKRVESESKLREELSLLKRQVCRLDAKIFPEAIANPNAFGANDWEYFFGKVGAVPSLPSDIDEILSSRCPFWPEKKVCETHYLVLIPASVNGHPLTLEYLVNTLLPYLNKCRENKISFRLSPQGQLRQDCFQRPNVESYWTLISIDGVPGTSSDLLYQGQSSNRQNWSVGHAEILASLTRRLPRLAGSVTTLLESTIAYFISRLKPSDQTQRGYSARIDYQYRVCCDRVYLSKNSLSQIKYREDREKEAQTIRRGVLDFTPGLGEYYISSVSEGEELRSSSYGRNVLTDIACAWKL